jgi:uncharacterized protein (TIGR02118 family)
MIKVSVFYPNEEGKKFDMEYYLDKHIPMVREKCGTACRDVAVDQGLGCPEPGSRPVYFAMGHPVFRLRRSISHCVWTSCGGNIGGYPQLHRHSADNPDKRCEGLIGNLV